VIARTPVNGAMRAQTGRMAEHFLATGWQVFPPDVRLEEWIAHALPTARRAVHDPDHQQWLRCGGTWYAGVNAMPNDGRGGGGEGPPLAGNCVDFLRQSLALGPFDWA